ncbi:MAG: NAD(P)-binding domain-containing protein [Polyangiaceae bacterium]|nr:NAD(P)-binding domain-containing protein [Polyangiaceae bacterium]
MPKSAFHFAPMHPTPDDHNRECVSGDLAPSPARICVIGAGPCGLAAMRELEAQGIDWCGYELSTRVGGLWDIEHQGQKSPAYDSLRIDSSKRVMAFRGHDYPDDVPEFPGHRAVRSYLQGFAESESLLARICFSAEVLVCEPLEGAGYRVQISFKETGETLWEEFDGVIVATGHHWLPQQMEPRPEREFRGQSFHSSQYQNSTTPAVLKDRKVVVVGFGNSAADIAVEAAKEARSVVLSVRRGAWVLPRYFLGKPIDEGSLLPHWIPGRLRRSIVTRTFRWLQGEMTQYGLPEPDHLIGEAHPTLSDELPALVRSGAIKMAGPIRGYHGKRIVFSACPGAKQTRQQELETDVLIYCTGYQVNFPFLDVQHVSVERNSLPLYYRVFHPQRPRLFFIGLAQTIGPIMPVAQAQARAIAEHIRGSYRLPATAAMEKSVAQDSRANQQRFITSPRHSMQVVPEVYLPKLAREVRLGSSRTRGVSFGALDALGKPTKVHED